MIAPSYRPNREDVNNTKDYFEKLGFKVTVPENLIEDDLLCSHNDQVRLAHIQDALMDPSVDYIWSLIGGYGLSRLLPSLLELKQPDKMKIFIGFSDATPLHIFLNQTWNWPTVHGFVAIQATLDDISQRCIQETFNLLERNLQLEAHPRIHPMNKAAKGLKDLSGLVVGGNLSLVNCSLGTEWQIQTHDKILFLEDIGERGYSVDRMLTHLKQAKSFDNVKAVLIGDFVGGEEPNGGSKVNEVLENFANSSTKPFFRMEGYGHGYNNFPLPLHHPISFEII